MILVAGAVNLREARWLFANGAGEVYCGLPDVPNHRRLSLSLTGLAELYDIIDLARAEGKRALLLLNQPWAASDYPRLTEKVFRAVGRGASGVVLKDLFLARHLRAAGVKAQLILSTLGLVFNSRAAALFRESGVTRFILPGQLPPLEAESLIRARPRVETEMFYYPGHFCQNVDPLCKFCDWGGAEKACEAALRCAGGSYSMANLDLSSTADFMYDGYRLGVKYLKISRMRDQSVLRRVVRDARSLIELLYSGCGRERFAAAYRRAYVSDRV